LNKVMKHNCARSYEWTTAAPEKVVKLKAGVVCVHEPPRAREGVGISNCAYEIRQCKKVWTAI
jgi:hypothetical protein